MRVIVDTEKEVVYAPEGTALEYVLAFTVEHGFEDFTLEVYDDDLEAFSAKNKAEGHHVEKDLTREPRVYTVTYTYTY